ncbi:MAG: 30S ribosomal protein S2 [Candidatus Micrarchaeia archaeon]
MEEKNIQENENDDGFLVSKETYLQAGVHIGTKVKNKDMKDFIFKVKESTGIFILDLAMTDKRIREASKIISKYDPSEVLVVASRVYSGSPASKFCELTGINLMKGRFTPGSMTNTKTKHFTEPSLLIVCDPRGERQAISEAAKMGTPIIALCDTDNETKFIDYIIPVNNKGKKSLALLFCILARELMLKQGKIKSYDEFKYNPQYFEKLEEEE